MRGELMQSRRHGGAFGGLAPQTKLQATPPFETWNTLNRLSFCQFLECQDPAQTQSPPEKSKLLSKKFAAFVGNIFCVKIFPFLKYQLLVMAKKINSSLFIK